MRVLILLLWTAVAMPASSQSLTEILPFAGQHDDLFGWFVAIDGNVSTGALDLLDRRVDTISQSALADGPGLCRFAWDATGQPAGIYFFRIDSAAAQGAVGVLALQD